MARKYGDCVFQSGRYQAIGWEIECKDTEIWTKFDEPAGPALVETYTLDASLAGPDDADSAWTDDANGYDGSLVTFANTIIEGSETTNYLSARGFSTDLIEDLVITRVRHRFYGQMIGVSNFWKIAAVLFTHLGYAKGTTYLGVDTVPAWSEWVEDTPSARGRIQYPWNPEDLKNAEIRVYAYDAKSGVIVDANLHAIQVEVEYEQGWGTREASNETWSQTDPRIQ